jgi:putative peptide zinc metalloprotease protein
MEFNIENLRVSKDIDIQKINGSITIYSRSKKKCFVIGKSVYIILSNLDGKHSVKELSNLVFEYTERDILELLNTFYNLGFLNVKKIKKKTIRDFWRFKIELIDGNCFFNKDSWYIKFTSIFLLWGSLPVFALGMIAIYEKQKILFKLMQQQVNHIPVVALLIIFWFSSAAHEVAHAVVARYFGVSVPDIGVLFYALIPYAYTNLTFISLLNEKWKKLSCLFAGMLINLMISGIFGIVTALTLNTFCFEIMLLNVVLVLTNLMVFFKLDGYFILALLLDENHMRERMMNELIQNVMQLYRNLRSGGQVIKERHLEGSVNSNQLFINIFATLSIVYVPILIMSTIITVIQFFT